MRKPVQVVLDLTTKPVVNANEIYGLVIKMRVNRTYSIDYSTIMLLNDTVSAKNRSRYVDKAIKSRLEGELSYDISQESVYRILTHLVIREELTDSQRKVISNIMKELV